MKETILKQSSIIKAELHTPKDYEIDRAFLKSHIYDSILIRDNRKTQDKTSFFYNDYKFTYTAELDRLINLVRERFAVFKKQQLMLMDFWANNFYPNQGSEFSMNRQVFPHVEETPNYVMVYALNKEEESCNLVFDYINIRGETNTYYIKLKNNEYVIFPSDLKYRFEKNKAEEPANFITVTFLIR